MHESTESATPKMHGRTGVVFREPPKYWWLGKRERGPEPVKFLARAWTLGALTAPASTVEAIPAITESGKSAFGLRVSGTIDPPMDLLTLLSG